jgi:MYXO-CTERM domain-containing protein
VELNSTVNGTAFRIKSAFTNAFFNTASTVLTHAEINTKGLGPAPAGMAAHTFAYHIKRAFQFAYSDGRHEKIPVHKIASQLGMVFHAYHYIGKTITLRGTRYDIIEPGPGFSITYHHVLPEDFATEFKKRHGKTDEIAQRALTLNNADPTKASRKPEIAALYRQANAMLAVDPERPKPSDWQLKFDGLNAVGNTAGFWYKVDVPANSVQRLSITATAGEQPQPQPGTGGPGCGSRSGTGNTTPSKVGTLGMLMAVGVVVIRRRRRRQ